MGIVVSVAALVLYVPMSMVFVLGGLCHILSKALTFLFFPLYLSYNVMTLYNIMLQKGGSSI